MNIHMTSEVTKYVTNIIRMTFLIRYFFRYTQQSQNAFQKNVWQQLYPNKLHVNIEVQGLPVLTPIYTLLQPVTGWSLKTEM